MFCFVLLCFNPVNKSSRTTKAQQVGDSAERPGSLSDVPHHSPHISSFFALRHAAASFPLLLHGIIRRVAAPLCFLWGPFISLPVRVTSQERLCSLPPRKSWHLARPCVFSPVGALITPGKLSSGATSPPCSSDSKPLPDQLSSETNTFMEGNWARINSPCSAPNHNLL